MGTEATSKFVEINGLRLHYLDYRGTGPVILCIHGLTRCAHDFDSLATHLTDRYRVLSLDVRGRGDSEWGPPDRYNIHSYVSDLGAFLDRLEIARANLIGTSMGGRISIVYAGANPARIDRIVLNDIGPALDPAALANLNRWVRGAPSEFDTLDDVIAFYRSIGFGPRNEGDFRNIVKWLVKPIANGRLGWKMDPAISQPPPGIAPARSDGYWDEFARMVSPVLIVRGGLSEILTPEIAARMLAARPDAKMVTVPGVGHAPSLNEPESLAAISDFFGLQS